MQENVAQFALPKAMKIEDCQALYDFLKNAQGKPVTLDCSAVTRLGGLAAQIIVMASETRAQAGPDLVLQQASDAFQRSLATLGFDPATLGVEGEG